MCTQGQLQSALRACEINSAFALEQLERAAHVAVKMDLPKSRELYILGKEHLVPS